MNKFDDFVKMFNCYLTLKGQTVEICSDTKTVSYSSVSGTSLIKSMIPVIDMDAFAKKAYRKIVLPGSVSEDDTINTVDAFLINSSNEWYFIEFKDAKFPLNMKTNVLKKAYSNVYAVMDVLYTMREHKENAVEFDYANPIHFFQTHVSYILVFSASKNPEHTIQLKNHRLKHENYLPEFMKRLTGYIFKEAYAMTEDVFEHTFVKKIQYGSEG